MSIIGAAKSVLTGRTKIGIAGGVETGGAIIAIDVTSAYQVQSEATLPRYPVEADPSNPGYISDHVNLGEMTLTITGILSGSLSLTDAIVRPNEIPMTAEMKLRKLYEFQRRGTIIKIVGYGTDKSGAIASLANALSIPSGFYDTGVTADPIYFGTHQEEISNLAIGRITSSAKGPDTEVTFIVQKIFFATPGATSAASGGGKVKQIAPKADSAATKKAAINSTLRGLF